MFIPHAQIAKCGPQLHSRSTVGMPYSNSELTPKNKSLSVSKAEQATCSATFQKLYSAFEFPPNFFQSDGSHNTIFDDNPGDKTSHFHLYAYIHMHERATVIQD